MPDFSTEQLLIMLSSVVVLSYLFSVIGKYIKVPSVLLLLAAGMLLRYVLDFQQINFSIPPKVVELLGVIGLVMIILEAGLDLSISKDKLKVIRDAFFSAFVIFVVTTIGVTTVLYFLLQNPLNKCIVYAIPLSIMSSAIVIPSLHALTPAKKEFLVYEASFADIIGILFFNLFTEGEQVTSATIGHFFLNIGIAIPLSLILCAGLFLVLTKSKMGVRFFLVIALIVLLYAGGKLLHLPSLILVLMFGMLMNNWQLIKNKMTAPYLPEAKIKDVTHMLHSITAETSFIIRTFFFILFGYAINLSLISDSHVLLSGTIIVLVLFIVRWLYLRFFLHTRVYPEVFFIPRGLVTVLLFYRIPQPLKLDSFNEGILFFIIIASALVMMFGMLFYKQSPENIVEEN